MRFAIVLLMACSSSQDHARRVATAYRSDDYVILSDPAKCAAFCARFMQPGEKASCTVARADEPIQNKYGALDYAICKMEPR